jgi:hypothetical protein
MAPCVLVLGVGLYGLAMVIYPRPFGRLFCAVSKLGPATWSIDSRQREIRDGFVRVAGAVMILVALFFMYTLEFP